MGINVVAPEARLHCPQGDVACSAVDQNVEVSFKRKCVFGLRNFELRSGCRTLDLEGLEGSLKRAI